jgi:hypothetical protein
MTSIKLCAALAAILAISSGAAMAQAYGGDQYGDPSGYGPPPPPPNQGYQPDDQRGYGPPPPPSADQSGANGYAAQGQPFADQSDAYADRRDDYAARMDHYRSGQQLYQHQLRVYERARRDYDRQFGPGAYEHYYAEPPPPSGDFDAPR